MSDFDITGNDIDDALDDSPNDVEEVNASDYSDDSDDDSYEDEWEPLEDDISDEEMAQDGISETDLVIVNNDGSYVVLPIEVAQKLMGDPSFIEKVDAGFADIDDFSAYVKKYFTGVENES